MHTSILRRSEADGSDALIELARFFAVAAADNTQMCPMFSPCIDQAWHTLLVRPDPYAEFSRKACGQVLGHQVSLGDGVISWISDYEACFGKLPPIWFADAVGTVDQIAYATYRMTGEVFHSWDCNPITDDEEE